MTGVHARATEPAAEGATGTSRQPDDALALGGDGALEQRLELAAPVRVLGQEAHRHAVAPGRRELGHDAAVQLVGHLEQDPGAVAGLGIGPGGTAVVEVLVGRDPALDHVVAGRPVQARDERDAARVVLVARVVEAVGLGLRHLKRWAEGVGGPIDAPGRGAEVYPVQALSDRARAGAGAHLLVQRRDPPGQRRPRVALAHRRVGALAAARALGRVVDGLEQRAGEPGLVVGLDEPARFAVVDDLGRPVVVRPRSPAGRRPCPRPAPDRTARARRGGPRRRRRRRTRAARRGRASRPGTRRPPPSARRSRSGARPPIRPGSRRAAPAARARRSARAPARARGSAGRRA